MYNDAIRFKCLLLGGEHAMQEDSCDEEEDLLDAMEDCYDDEDQDYSLEAIEELIEKGQFDFAMNGTENNQKI
jgi:hypothetical protein